MSEVKLTRTVPTVQDYINNGDVIQIWEPNVGSCLKRIDRKKNITEYWVVTDIFRRKTTKQNPLNAGIVELIYLEKINNRSDTEVWYKPSTTQMILKLTNHGRWFTLALSKNYDHVWLDASDQPLIDLNPLSSIRERSNTESSSPIQIPIITVKSESISKSAP